MFWNQMATHHNMLNALELFTLKQLITEASLVCIEIWRLKHTHTSFYFVRLSVHFLKTDMTTTTKKRKKKQLDLSSILPGRRQNFQEGLAYVKWARPQLTQNVCLDTECRCHSNTGACRHFLSSSLEDLQILTLKHPLRHGPNHHPFRGLYSWTHNFPFSTM